MNLIKKLCDLFTRPTRFFEKVEKEGWNIAWGTLIASYTVFNLIQYTITNLTILSSNELSKFPELQSMMGGSATPVYLMLLMFSFFMTILAAAVLPFLMGAILHIGAWLLKGTGTFWDSFKVACYTQTLAIIYNFLMLPFTLVSLFFSLSKSPIADFLSWGVMLPLWIVMTIHIILTKVKGFQVYHQLTAGQAFVAVLVVPLLIIGILAVIFMVPILAFIAMLS